MKLEWVKSLPEVPLRRKLVVPFNELASRPEQWAVLRRYKNVRSAYPAASRLNNQYQHFEFTARKDGAGAVLYARYLRKRRDIEE